MVETKLFSKNEIILLINVKVLNILVKKLGKSYFNVLIGGNGEKKGKTCGFEHLWSKSVFKCRNCYLNARLSDLGGEDNWGNK